MSERITIYRGVRQSFSVQFLHPVSGEPVDMTGATVRASLRRSLDKAHLDPDDDNVLLQLTTAEYDISIPPQTGDNKGVVELTFSRAATALEVLESPAYWMDVRGILPSGDETDPVIVIALIRNTSTQTSTQD